MTEDGQAIRAFQKEWSPPVGYVNVKYVVNENVNYIFMLKNKMLPLL